MSARLKPFSLRALVTVMMLGALLCATGFTRVAYAQESGGEASEEITISEDEPGATEAAPEKAAEPEKPLLKVRPKMTDRDPFRNPIASGEVHGATVRRPTRSAGRQAAPPKVTGAEASGETSKVEPPDGEGETGAAAAAEAPAYGDEEEEEINPPAVTVTGIITSGSGRRAILTSPDQSYIVSVGDKLSEYKVSAISERAVSFTIKDRTFKLVMEDEFGLHGGK